MPAAIEIMLAGLSPNLPGNKKMAMVQRLISGSGAEELG